MMKNIITSSFTSFYESIQLLPYHYLSNIHIYKTIYECLVEAKYENNIFFAILTTNLWLTWHHRLQTMIKNSWYWFWGSMPVPFSHFQLIVFILTVCFINIKHKNYSIFGHFPHFSPKLFKTLKFIILRVNASFNLQFIVDYLYLQVDLEMLLKKMKICYFMVILHNDFCFWSSLCPRWWSRYP